METILVATDLTQRSAQAVLRAGDIARAQGARLIVLHTLDRPRLSRDGLARIQPQTIRARKAERAMQQTRADLQAQGVPDMQVITRIETDPAPDVVPQIAASEDADLIVLGLHRERRVLDMLRLTKMEKIVLAAQCPVLIAHRPVTGSYRRVLGAVTFTPASARALECAATLAPDAELHAIHAAELPFREKVPALDADFGDGPRMTEASLLRERFMSMDGVPTNLSLPEIVPGGMHEVLAFRVAELNPDLLVIGTHSGRTGDRLGNYTRDLMRAPPTDVLIAKPN